MIVREPYKDSEFRESNIQQLDFLAETIKDVKSFISMIKFNSDSNDQTNRLLSAERAKLQAALDHKKKMMSNYALTENIALGCLAQCFFCGARCM